MHLLQEDLHRYIDAAENRADKTAIVAHLAECDECQLKLAQTSRAAWKGNERRHENRITAEGPARIKVLDPILSSAPSGKAWVVNTSQKGIKLRVSEWVKDGAILQMRFEHGAFALGEVRYCSPVGKEFYLGIRLLEAFPRG